MLQSRGVEYTLRNASGGGGRSSPDYSDDGTLTGALERRTRPTVETLSSGETVESELEIRAVDIGPTIVGQGNSDYPSKLVHPDGQTFEVVTTHPEDSGVTVMSVVRD